MKEKPIASPWGQPAMMAKILLFTEGGFPINGYRDSGEKEDLSCTERS
jgi:hypothetical protein